MGLVLAHFALVRGLPAKRSQRPERVRRWLVGAGYIAVPPLLLAVAFLAWDAKIPWGLIVLAGIIGFVAAPKRA